MKKRKTFSLKSDSCIPFNASGEAFDWILGFIVKTLLVFKCQDWFVMFGSNTSSQLSQRAPYCQLLFMEQVYVKCSTLPSQLSKIIFLGSWIIYFFTQVYVKCLTFPSFETIVFLSLQISRFVEIALKIPLFLFWKLLFDHYSHFEHHSLFLNQFLLKSLFHGCIALFEVDNGGRWKEDANLNSPCAVHSVHHQGSQLLLQFCQILWNEKKSESWTNFFFFTPVHGSLYRVCVC